MQNRGITGQLPPATFSQSCRRVFLLIGILFHGVIMESRQITAPAQYAQPERQEPYGCPQRELLGFTVRTVDNEYDLARVRDLRARAYGHHLPMMAAQFGKEDPLDMDPDVVVFCAEDKATGEVVGSCRIQVNRNRPLQIHGCIEEPPHLRGLLVSEISRLVVHPGYGDRLVRMGIVKACHLHNIATQVAGIYAGSRPALMRQYRALGFSDLYEDKREVPLSYTGGIPHRILWLNNVTAEQDWARMNNPFYHFVFRAWHPDISIFAKAFPGISRAQVPHENIGRLEMERI